MDSITEGIKTAEKALGWMGISKKDVRWLLRKGEDGVRVTFIEQMKQCRNEPCVVIVGDYNKCEKMGMDAYDLATKFAEDNYERVRQSKLPCGAYVVIMTNRLPS